MLRLFRTVASADWKGRPTHSIYQVATGTFDELIWAMSKDVVSWQDQELAELKEIAKENGEAPPTEWREPNVRWEMALSPADNDGVYPKTLREFAWNDSGEFSSMVYHILDLP